jgi:peroxiredoxin
VTPGSASGAIEESVAQPATLQTGRLILALAFAAFTVWIHYQVKFVRARGAAGTVQELGATKVGAPAPEFAASDLDGHEVSLVSRRGEKIVLLEFWATWCPPCRMVMATLRGMRSELESAGVEVFNVNQRESTEDVRRFVEREHHEFRVVVDRDGAISDRYSVRSLPTMVLIDKRGIVRWIHVGHLPETGELQDLLHKLAAE